MSSANALEREKEREKSRDRVHDREIVSNHLMLTLIILRILVPLT